MSEISTRIWLDEHLWDGVRSRADAEGTTIRALIPELLAQSLASSVARAEPVRPPSVEAPPQTLSSPAGPPVVGLSDNYLCGVCGAQIRLGGLSNHLGRHVKEQQAAEGERSS